MNYDACLWRISVVKVVLFCGCLSLASEQGLTNATADEHAAPSASKTATADPQAPDWGVAERGLRCRIRPLRKHFSPNQDIEIEFSVQNVSDKEIHLFTDSFARFVNLTLDGKGIRRADYREDWDVRESEAGFTTVASGKSWTTRIDVSKLWLPEKPLTSGKLIATYQNETKNGSTVGILGWAGVLTSNACSLSLVKSDRQQH